MDFTFQTALYLCIGNLVISTVFSTLSLYFDKVAMMVYMSVIGIILFSMIVLYSLSYLDLRRRATQAKSRNATRTTVLSQNQTTVPATTSGITHPTISITSVPVISVEQLTPSPRLSNSEHTTQHTTITMLPRSETDNSNLTDSKVEHEREPEENQHNAGKTTMEVMTERSAKVFSTITFVYIICFIPNVLLTLMLFIIGEEFMFTPKPAPVQIILRYSNSLFNLNFLAMPMIYVILSPQFAKDFKKYVQRMQHCCSCCTNSYV